MDHELLERQDLLGAAHRVIESARSGTGGMLVFEGPAGIGKSTLLDAVASSAGAIGVARASPTELERAGSFGVVRQLLKPLLDRLPPGRRRALFRGPGAAARRVLDAVDEASPVTGVTSVVLYGLLWLLGDLASSQPLLLLIDDAQWSDEPSLAWLVYATARIRALPVAVVAATRPPPSSARGQLTSLLTLHRDAEILTVPPLSTGAVTAIVRRSLGPERAAERGESAFAATGGNAFLLAELIRGWARRPDVTTPLTTAALRRSIARRVQHIEPDGARLAEAVAVLGGARVELRHAGALSGIELERAADLAGALADAHVLGTGLPLAFVHPLVHDAVYEAIAEPRRAVTHRAAARMLHAEGADADAVAAHLLLAVPAGDGWCVARLREAARRALARGAADSAVELLRRALAEPPIGPERRRVQHELGAAEMRAGDPAAEDHLRAALDGARGAEAAEVAITLGRLLMSAGRGGEAVRLLERAQTAAGDDVELGLRIEGEQFGAARMEPRAVTVPMRSPSHEHPQLRGETPGERMLLASLATKAAAAGTSARLIESLATRALRGELLLRDEGPEAQIVLFLGPALGQIDRYTLALAHYDAVLEDARRCGSVLGYALARMWRADTLLRRGDLTEAEADALDALALATEHGLQLVTPLALYALTAARVELGKLDEAEASLAAARLDGPIPDAGLFAGVQHARGRLRLARGRHEDALADLLASGRTMLRGDFISPAPVSWRSDAAVALTHLGRTAEARRLAAEETRLARQLGADRALGVALRAHALAGPPSRRITGLRAAARRLHAAPAPVELARVTIDLGIAQLRAGDRDTGRASLRAALDLAERHHASGLAARAYDELLVAGARPRRRRLTGRDALTAGELRVARLAATGYSNREIAAELFLTHKTIEAHLGHVYSKLSITGRGELASALTD